MGKRMCWVVVLALGCSAAPKHVEPRPVVPSETYLVTANGMRVDASWGLEPQLVPEFAQRVTTAVQGDGLVVFPHGWPVFAERPRGWAVRVGCHGAEWLVCDGFRYALLIARDGRFWIEREGGLAGVREYCGPGVVAPDGSLVPSD